ncbi:MAG: hypothetical protein M3P04_01460 [Actinomycetota bacterium]|nr:hypothetical protein [Actinomycetota bacterium]
MTFPSFTSFIPRPTRTTTSLQNLSLALLPHGGQRSARRNAWASMSSDAVLARSRREADAAVAAAAMRAERTVEMQSLVAR